ncbi:TPA: hypothetical protein ACJ51Q_001353, partial [Streptococcus suis]
MGRRRSEKTNVAAFTDWNSEELNFIASILDSPKTLESLIEDSSKVSNSLEFA